MEPTEVIIARLVLGYLKTEKCKSAYKEFIKTSSTLQGDTTFAKSKYIPTRFVGLTLEDILSEYFEIYKIVQGRLEATNYYNEFHSKTSLVQQLLYLFYKVNSSRTSTPCPRSPLESNLDETSTSHIDHISDVETTPAHTLPGNVRCTSEDSYLHKGIRRRPQSKISKSSTVNDLSGIEKEDMSEMLAHTLLENREFQEKIAQTINKVAEKQYKMSAELDKTIKTVVRETEEDPMFDKILEEIIGSSGINDNNKEVDSTSSSVRKSNEDIEIRSKRNYIHSNFATSDDRYRYSNLDSQIVEEQNNEAIRSIVANANSSTNLQGNVGINSHDNGGLENNDVIVFDGSLDKYLKSNTCNATTQTQQVAQNPLYINNTGRLLMLPANITTNARNLNIDSSKQYYIVNKQQTVNWAVPTIKPPNVLTEQDILAMPTVIVNDGITTQSVLQTPISASIQTSMTNTIVPIPTSLPSSLGEYLTFYGAKEPQRKGLKKVLYPKKLKPNSTTVNPTISDTTITLKSMVDITNENKSFTTALKIDQSSKDGPTMQIHEQELKKPQLSEIELASKTPAPLEQVQKVTPKSGSHVRNLDFSTPPKITSTHKKSIKSSETKKTPPFVHKKQAAKALFPQQDVESSSTDLNLDKNDTESKITNRKLTYVWDADLRSIIATSSEVKSQTPKRKQKSLQTKKKRRKIQTTSKTINPELNTTEHDAALLEAALQTPVKTNVDNSQIVDSSIIDMKVENNEIKENICTSASDNKGKIYKSSSNNINEKSKSNNIKSKKIAKDVEAADGITNKMILSPSKLNASKRNLLNTDMVPSDVRNKSGLKTVVEKNKFITPEMTKETIQHPIKANRNIMPMLETPVKHDYIPKTPGLQTPINASMDLNISLSDSRFTPFSKMLEENLEGIDIGSLPTPNIPITPNFPPFTPTVVITSPYSNRPTDYSTSSSYYQPSDSEQNRSLEANVKEIEKKPIKILSNELLVPENGYYGNANKNGKDNLSYPTIANEHLNIFNKSIIGKKNLNLMKRNVSSSEETSSEEEANSDSSHWNEKESNDTVIFNKKVTETPRRTYLLRNRTVTADKEELHKLPIATKDIKINKAQITKVKKPRSKVADKTSPEQPNEESKLASKSEKDSPKKTQNDKQMSNVDTKEDGPKAADFKKDKQTSNADKVHIKKVKENSDHREKVLHELEQKRLRVISKFKSLENSSQKKSAGKAAVRQNAKFMKIKPIPNITNTKRKPRKSVSPKKSVPNKSSKDTDNDLDNLKNDKSKIISYDGIFPDKSTSDVEAENLIEGLKERGIHLMHNKSSPNKKLDGSSIKSDLENKSCKHLARTDLMKNDITENVPSTPAGINNSSGLKKNELSTSHLETELRDIYDVQVFDEYECVVFDESKKVTKTFEDYNTKVLEKKFTGKVFIEEINEEIDVSLSFSPFYTLFDLEPTGLSSAKQMRNSQTVDDKISQLEKKTDLSKGELSLTKQSSILTVSEDITKSDDDLMNYAIVGSLREENSEGSESPKSTKRRKIWNGGSSPAEKKCKTLLKKINVDSFLNNIHGGS